MSNHIHLITSSPEGRLSETLRDFKKFTAKTIINTFMDGNESRWEWMLNRFNFNANRNSRSENFQFWMHENHAEILYSKDLEYLHNNPVRARIVEKQEDCLCSRAHNYADMDGLLEIACIYPKWKTY